MRATLPQRFRSVRGRTEFTLVQLVAGTHGWLALPVGKGSGSVSTFARADGFFVAPALTEQIEAGTDVDVTLLGAQVTPAELVIMGSHCPGLDTVVSALSPRSVKVLAVGSRAGLDALAGGACHVAPIHLFDAETQQWNAPFLPEGATLTPGYRRQQVLAYRRDDAAHYAGGTVEGVLQRLAPDDTRRVANRNPGSGTRMLLDPVIGDGPTPPGWATAYKSHSAVAAAIASGRADYGICVLSAAKARDLDYRPWREEHYDFAVAPGASDSPGVQAFLDVLKDPAVRQTLADAGFSP